MSTFWTIPEYKIIVFSTSKEATKLNDNPYDSASVKLQKAMGYETKDIEQIHDNLYDQMKKI